MRGDREQASWLTTRRQTSAGRTCATTAPERDARRQ